MSHVRNISQTGFTLMEVMISVAISLVLLILLTELYLGSEKSMRLQEALQTMQADSARAIAVLTSQINKAGDIGCAKLSADFPILSFQHDMLTSENKIAGNKDSITVRYTDMNGVTLMEPMVDSSTLIASTENKYKQGDILLISDCRHAEIFRVEHASSSQRVQRLSTSSPLHYLFDRNADIGELNVNQFYVDHRENKFGLMMKNIRDKKEKLVTSVTEIHFSYDSLGVAIDITTSVSPFSHRWHAYVSL